MNKFSLLGLLAFIYSMTLMADEGRRVYIPMKNLVFAEDGIYYQSRCTHTQLEDIAYDYTAQAYYLFDDQRRTIVTCSYCGVWGWWVQGNCCFNDGCSKSCF
jgi:hypothetical protein